MEIKKIAVLGGGNGGVTAAADYASRGFEVNLFEAPAFFNNLTEIKRRGGVLFKEKQEDKFTDGKFVEFAMVTDNINQALKGADLVVVVVPSFAIEAMAKLAVPVLTKYQIVIIMGSDSLNALRFVKVAKDMGVDTAFKIGAASSLPYATRVFYSSAEVELSLWDKRVLFSAYPAKDTDILMSFLKKIYPHFYTAKNIFETTLDNGNPESHPGPCIYNAGRIEYSKGEFWLYREGITEHTVNIVKAIDKERQELCLKMGFEVLPKDVRNYLSGYFESTEAKGTPLHVLYNTSKAFYDIKGPAGITNRYITEDIPMGLVLWSSLGKALKVPTPAMDAVITMGSILLEKDYWNEGLTLQKLGLGGLSIEELIDSVS